MKDQEYFRQHLSEAVDAVDLIGFHKVHTGKVRDTLEYAGSRIIITSDRQSAFDRVLTTIPFKGQMLNLISAFWFEHTKDIVGNHLIAVPDPAVSIVRKAKVFPVEVIVRGYMTGSTDTSVWKNYEKGVRDYCGIRLPEGMSKNEPFASPIITPTTKPQTGHDELISPAQIIDSGLMSAKEWNEVAGYAMQIFLRGQQMLDQRGLILVDTKFEFGTDVETGKILLIDEVLTPDSSRLWMKSSYLERFAAYQEQQSFDKEFLRLWYQERCNPYLDSVLPEAPDDLRARLASIYAEAYEMITGNDFKPAHGGKDRIRKNLDEYFASR